MDYAYFTDTEEDSPVSDVPLHIIEDEIRYLLDIKYNVDRANEERVKRLRELRADKF